MSDQGTADQPADIGSRIDPVLARSWLLVNGAQYERFTPAAHSRADIVVLDIEDAVAPKDKDSARGHVIKWLKDGNSDWVRAGPRAHHRDRCHQGHVPVGLRNR
jgi:citrate lyase subunit beta/citryl-CoA lyase